MTGRLEKVLITCTEAPGVSVTAQFNPKELQIDKDVGWNPIQGARTENPKHEFTGAKPFNLSCTLYFDTFESKEDVYDKYVSRLEAMVKIGPLQRPPLVLFTWHKVLMKGVVTNLSQKYTMFLPDGRRCRCEVGFKMSSADEASVNIPSSK